MCKVCFGFVCLNFWVTQALSDSDFAKEKLYLNIQMIIYFLVKLM